MEKKDGNLLDFLRSHKEEFDPNHEIIIMGSYESINKLLPDEYKFENPPQTKIGACDILKKVEEYACRLIFNNKAIADQVYIVPGREVRE